MRRSVIQTSVAYVEDGENALRRDSNNETVSDRNKRYLNSLGITRRSVIETSVTYSEDGENALRRDRNNETVSDRHKRCLYRGRENAARRDGHNETVGRPFLK